MNKKVAIIGVVGAVFVYFVWKRRKNQKDLEDPAKQDVLEEATGPMWYETGMVQKVFKFLNEEMKKRGHGAVAIQAQTFTPMGTDIQSISSEAFRDANRIMAEKLLETKAYINNAEMKQAYKLWLLRDTRLDKPRETKIDELGASPMPTYTDVVFNNPTPQPTSYVIKQGL
jgi:hypothetical protein